LTRRCDKCGEEITFRKLDGRTVPIHIRGSCGHRSPYSSEQIRKATTTKCMTCRRECFLVRHNGGQVLIEELGYPWPKHTCVARKQRPAAGSVVAVSPGQHQSRPQPSVSKPFLRPDTRRKCQLCDVNLTKTPLEVHLLRCPKRITTSTKPREGSAILTVQHINGKQTFLTVNDLSQFRTQKITVANSSQPITFEGIVLTDLFSKTAHVLKAQQAASLYLLLKQGLAAGRSSLGQKWIPNS
jgi:hypothetical protein